MYYSLEKHGVRHMYRFYDEILFDDAGEAHAFLNTDEMINFADTTEIEVGNFVISLLNDGIVETYHRNICYYNYILNGLSDTYNHVTAKDIIPELKNIVDSVFLSTNTHSNYDNYFSCYDYTFQGNELLFSKYILENTPFQTISFFDNTRREIRDVFFTDYLHQMICHEIILMIKYNIKLGVCPSCKRYYIVHNNMHSCGAPSCQRESTQKKFYSNPIKKRFYAARSLISSQQARNPASNVNASEFLELYKEEYVNYLRKYEESIEQVEKEQIEKEFARASRLWVEDYRERVRNKHP